MICADGALVAVHTASQAAAGTRYVHRDHLESTQALTDAAGGLVERIRLRRRTARSARQPDRR